MKRFLFTTLQISAGRTENVQQTYYVHVDIVSSLTSGSPSPLVNFIFFEFYIFQSYLQKSVYSLSKTLFCSAFFFTAVQNKFSNFTENI